MKSFFKILVLALFCLSCRSELPDKKELIAKNLESLHENLFLEKDNDCKERALIAAETHLDSVIDQWINTGFMDTISFPVKPLKPQKPEHILGTFKKFDVDSSLIR